MEAKQSYLHLQIGTLSFQLHRSTCSGNKTSKKFITWLTLSQTTHFIDSSKLKEFADNNFKLDENGRHFFKQLESNVGKGKIAHYEQFLLFPQCFQKTCAADM